ncbi:diguanylate cyclase [Acidicapsa acidisoli]|uniref:diguanylate cyclase n=1 Tax=Acidicapsa acidisoli TaxID=1615681 RepID=UPI0021E07129|nr:diguanylate cyclase [Acidicapsa acidisoli]
MLRIISTLSRRIERQVGPNSAVALLIAAAIGAVCFTVMAGALVYGNTRSLISSGEWVQHTQEVLASLQRVSLLTERIEYRSRLYTLTGNEEQLTRARASANQLETTLVHLKVLVADSDYQTRNLQILVSNAQYFEQALNNFTVKSELSAIQLQQNQQAIGLMTDHEQSLLQERSKGSQQSSFTSISAEVAFVGVSLISLVVLFGLLLRDAVRRQTISKQTALTNERLARTVNELEDRAHESELLTSARDELQLCVEVHQVYESAANSFSRLLLGTSGSLCMINNSRQLVEVVSSWQGSSGESAVEDFHPPDSCCGLRSGQPRWRQPGVSEIHCTHFSSEAPDRYLCKPIVAHGNTLGMLYVQCASEAVLKAVNLRTDGLRQLVQLTGMAIATLNLRTKLENQSIRDSLTGLFNRHFMQISLERELSRAARRKQTLAVFMLDLDHFKKFNDTFGHAAGDTVLKAVAEIFRANIRAEDIACRYGGEEFTIILPDVTPAIALERAESIRRSVANVRLPLDREVYSEFSISIGVALYPNDGETSDLLLRRADMALYRAKRAGRNQVSQFEAVTMAT